MASVEISSLLALNSHKFIYFPPFLCCISSPILKLLGHCDGSNKKDHTEDCWEPPWLLRAGAASASVWGAGSLQVLKLTPASPVSTCTTWPPSLRPAVLLNPGSTAQAPLQWHPQSSPESCSSGLNGPIHAQPGEPTALHPGSFIKAWTPSTGAFSAWF